MPAKGAEKDGRLATAVLLCGFALSLAYALRIAPGNAPDEKDHVWYVLQLREHGALPAWEWPEKPESWQARQPPLYYAAAAALTKPFESAPARTQLGLMRFLSALLHAGALALVWRIASRLFAGASALGPLLLVALLPQFVFIGAYATNDAAADLAGAALLSYAVAVVLDRSRGGRAPLGYGLGALVGLALLAKATPLPVAAASTLCLWDPKDVRASVRRVLRAGAAAVAVGGWFYLRNQTLYGDAFGTGARFARYDPDRFGWDELHVWLGLFFSSWFGRFGWMTQPLPLWAYAFPAALTLAALAGWARKGAALRRLPARPLLLAALGLALAQNFWIGFMMSHQPQARLSFPALAAWAVLMWDGLSVWSERWPSRRRRWAALALLAAAAATHGAAYLSL